MRKIHGFCRAAVAVLLLGAASGTTWAEAHLSGSADQIVLQAKNATMLEVVSGLESLLHVKIKLMGSTTRQFTGVYSGSMRQVLSRLLDGMDYVIGSAPEGLAIMVFARNGARPAAPRPAEREVPDDGSSRTASWMGPNDEGTRRPNQPAQPVAPSAQPVVPSTPVQPTPAAASWMGPNDDGTSKPIQPRPAIEDGL